MRDFELFVFKDLTFFSFFFDEYSELHCILHSSQHAMIAWKKTAAVV